MARDEQLYTGKTSQSSGAQRVKEQVERNLDNKSKLVPRVKALDDFIEEEKKSLIDLTKLVLEDKTEAQLEVDLKVRKGVYVALQRIQNKMSMILRAEAKEKDE